MATPEDFNRIDNPNPRLQLIQQLKKAIEPTCNIVAYNAEFEIKILRLLAVDFPEEAAYIDSLIERFVDLLVVFRNA